jgi:hypothetical protein
LAAISDPIPVVRNHSNASCPADRSRAGVHV